MKMEKKNSETSVLCEDTKFEPPSGTKLLSTIMEQRETEVQKKSEIQINPKTLQFIQQNFPKITLNDWNNWRWQIKNSYTSYEQLQSILNLSENEVKPNSEKNNLPIRITPYYASLLDRFDSEQPLRKSVVPVFNELIVAPEEKLDPLDEEGYSPVKNIVHRYPDRVLFLATGRCSTYCRYCTRTHMVSKKDKCHSSLSEWDMGINYIRNHTNVRDVLISGGDPLTLSDSKLEYLLYKLRSIKHVEFIRIGTKVPAVLPQRITPFLVKRLKKYHPLFISVHFTHPDELTPETIAACNRLADAGIPLGSQTVLLKDINDKSEVIKKLTHELLKARVRPYYLYQCDLIPGSAHFRTSVEKGIEIIKKLRGFTSGYAVPHYVIDAPHGGGKIPVLPNYIKGRENGNLILTNYEDRVIMYPNKSE